MYNLISTKEVLKNLCPKKGKSTEDINEEIRGIRKISEKLLKASKNPNPTIIDVIITKDAIRQTRTNLENCLKELSSRN